MRQVLNVTTPDKGYTIEISDNSFSKLNEDIDEATKGQKRLIVISQKVYDLYYNKFNFNKNELFILKDGEQEKNYKNYLKIIDKAIKLGLTRKDVMIALGGGVVGDITGFAASTYMRGIDYIQVPTTLLSAVDSSVGGKTAIDLNDAKNIIGTFHQPKAVFINTNFLDTLDERQFLSGLGEVLKYAFIEENCGYGMALHLFEFLTLGCDKVLHKDSMTIIRLIEYCLNLKTAVVNQDEKEIGLRKVLNFGHTLAHALETITKYRQYTHGEAVIYGIFFILKWAYQHEYITYSYYRLSVELLEKYGFKPLVIKFPAKKLVEIMKKDKKASGEKITFIIPYANKKVKEIKLTPQEVIYMFEDAAK